MLIIYKVLKTLMITEVSLRLFLNSSSYSVTLVDSHCSKNRILSLQLLKCIKKHRRKKPNISIETIVWKRVTFGPSNYQITDAEASSLVFHSYKEFHL